MQSVTAGSQDQIPDCTVPLEQPMKDVQHDSSLPYQVATIAAALLLVVSAALLW
jgi:hypothetical protein